MSSAENQLQRWLISQEPIDKYFRKKIVTIDDYMPEDAEERIFAAIREQTNRPSLEVKALIKDTLANIHPFCIYTKGQFQAINDEVFSINGVVFSSKDVCMLLRRSEYVIPHIISSGKEIEDYALLHTSNLHREIIRVACSLSNQIGRHLIIDQLINRYDINQIVPIFPGEPGWAIQEGLRFVNIFEKIAKDKNLEISQKGISNIMYTAYGIYSCS